MVVSLKPSSLMVARTSAACTSKRCLPTTPARRPADPGQNHDMARSSNGFLARRTRNLSSISPAIRRSPSRCERRTKAVDPKRQAVWTLGDLYQYFMAWSYDVYDTTPHPALEMSPRETF